MEPQNQNDTPIQGLPVVDGTNIPVATDSTAVNAIDPNPANTLTFESGNFKEFQTLADSISAKVTIVTNTILPLVEAALIELLGKSSLYRRESFNVTPSFTGMAFMSNVSVKYHIDSWIATDVATEDISQDASYVYNRIKVVPNVQWTKCEVDTTEGSLSLEFTL